MFKKLILTAGSLLLMTTTSNAASDADTLKLELSTGGTVTIEMLPDRAPAHVERIKKLTREGFYDGIVFHRVIDGFMAQTGDPTGTGTGGSSEPDLPAEFTDYAYKRGTIGMARTANPNSANSQFFICFSDDGCSFLTGQYTVWGQVTDGMEHVDAIARGEPPANPDKIIKASIAGDAANDSAAAPAPAEETAAETPAETPAEAEITEPAAGEPSAEEASDSEAAAH
ncbi:MAG: peptidylprolyl isomerase [Rhodospirillales bacterium]|nr:peptidylprolyl isomerase [Alphaproteobacteria bacterium]MCB9981156.1 peptidylprolyl isomerase [Rhodospirillales bacterium]